MIDLNELTEEEAAAVVAVQEEAKRLADEYGPNPNYAQLAEGSRRLRDFTRDPEFPGIGPNGLVLEAAVPPLQGRGEGLLNVARMDAWAALSTETKVSSLTGTVRMLERMTKATAARLAEVESQVAAIESQVAAIEAKVAEVERRREVSA